MFTVGLNFMTQPASVNQDSRRMYTETYQMPAVPRTGELISSLNMSGPNLPGGYVTGVTWVLGPQDEWLPYVDVQTDVPFDDHSLDRP